MTDDLANATNVRPKTLATIAGLGTASATAYSVPASTSTVVRKGLVCNTSASTVNFTMRVTKNGSNTATIYSALPILPGDTVDLTEIAGFTLGPLDSFTAFASSASVLHLALSGIESA